ncbi:uncharacterized protein Dvar_40260 [Desulfosarcina variabilis str. Montpellier]
MASAPFEKTRLTAKIAKLTISVIRFVLIENKWHLTRCFFGIRSFFPSPLLRLMTMLYRIG